MELPGCYGLPSAVSATSASCRACPVRASCVHEALALLALLPDNPLTQRERQALSVTRSALASSPAGPGRPVTAPLVVASSRGVKRVVLSASQLAQLAGLPARVASQVRQLMERGWFDFARQELRAGRNPAGKGWKRVLCDLLLTGHASRAGLELALVERLDMTAGSARAQASVGIAIFAAGRLVTEQFGRLVLSPN